MENEPRVETMEDNRQLNFSESSHYESNEDNIPIKLMVCDPVVKDGLQKFILYTVKGSDKDGAFEAYRRYSDFFHLREVLVVRWPGCYIPPMAPKKAMGNLNAKFIEDRRKQLEDFLLAITALRHLYYSDEFRIFLRSGNNEVEKALGSLPKQTNEDLISKYHQNFNKLSGKEINTELVLKITTFITYIKKIKVQLDNFKLMAKNTCKARKAFNEQFQTFSSFLMPEYEKNCLQEYINGGDDKLIFAQTNDPKLNQTLNAIRECNNSNAYEALADLLKVESKEISAFQDAVNQKQIYELQKEKAQQKQKDLQIELQKILAGKTTLKSMFTKGSKAENVEGLEKNIQNTQKEVESLSLICDIITVMLGYIEIDRFKNEKAEHYYSIVKKMTTLETDYARNTQEFWQFIASNPNVLMSEVKQNN